MWKYFFLLKKKEKLGLKSIIGKRKQVFPYPLPRKQLFPFPLPKPGSRFLSSVCEKERCTRRNYKNCATRNCGICRNTWVKRRVQITTHASVPQPHSPSIINLKPFILPILVNLPKKPKTTPLVSPTSISLNLLLLLLLFALPFPILLLLLPTLLFHSLLFPPLPLELEMLIWTLKLSLSPPRHCNQTHNKLLTSMLYPSTIILQVSK